MAKNQEQNAGSKGAETSEVKKEQTVTCLYLSYQSCHFTHKGKDFSLHNNETYELPDCKFVQSLIKQGRLTKK
jgi:hypothetical protein